jgi:hypothetical protein
LAHASGNPCSKLSFASFQNLEQSAIPLNSSSSLLGSKSLGSKSKFSGALRRSYGYTEAAHGSSKEHKKSRQGGKTQANFKTFAKKDAASARAAGCESQTITKLSRGRPSESEDASIALFLNVF